MSLSLEDLDRQSLRDEYTIVLEIREAGFKEQRRFKLYLKDDRGNSSENSVFEGLYSAGRPSQNIRGWIDGDYFDQTSFDGKMLDLSDRDIDKSLFSNLGRLIPDGGTLMVAYTMFAGETSIHRETRAGLDVGILPAATPIGVLLFEAGCGLHIRNWYIPEGGREGPPKLQGYKPLDENQKEEWEKELEEKLKTFVGSKEESWGELREHAAHRAKEIFERLGRS